MRSPGSISIECALVTRATNEARRVWRSIRATAPADEEIRIRRPPSTGLQSSVVRNNGRMSAAISGLSAARHDHTLRWLGAGPSPSARMKTSSHPQTISSLSRAVCRGTAPWPANGTAISPRSASRRVIGIRLAPPDSSFLTSFVPAHVTPLATPLITQFDVMDSTIRLRRSARAGGVEKHAQQAQIAAS